MGQIVLQGLAQDPELQVMGAVDVRATTESTVVPGTSLSIPLSRDVPALLGRCHPSVLVDFSIAEATVAASRAASAGGVNLVVGTTGLSPAQVQQIGDMCRASGVGAVVAPNFSLGAILLMHLARLAAPYFEYAEIMEMHHEKKIDAPSGTALATAKDMVQARGRPFRYTPAQKEPLSGTRGGQFQGIAIHSMRMPGFLAHQEVILGGQGQTLSLRHDTIGRDCYVPGIILAVKHVVKAPGLTYGLEAILGLKEAR